MDRKTVLRLLVILVVLVLPCTAAFSEGLSVDEVRQLIIRTDNNTAPLQFESYVTMKNYKPSRDTTVQQIHFYRKEDKIVGIVVNPVSQKGQAFIRNGDNMWMYLPKSEKVIRISPKETSMGGQASNADILRIDLAKDYDSKYLGDEVVDKYPCYKIEMKAKLRTVAYDRMIYWISREKELPVKREFYTISGKLIKTLYCKDFKILGGRERPTLNIIESATNKNLKTEVIYESMNTNVSYKDNIFNPSYVKRLQ